MSEQVVLKWTYGDYLSFSGDKRYEIINGERYMVPSPITYHQRILLRLGRIISEFVEREMTGEIFISPCDVVLSDENIVQPDILYISKNREKIITKKNIKGAPDLLIEILSRGTRKRDKIEKKKLYAKSGVTEYWVVDPDSKTLEVMISGKRGYTTVGVYGSRENLTSPMFKNLLINLEKVF